MGKTIIQTIGPLYGEVVNGTVFGRPNGSVFVPNSNTITATLDEEYRYIYKANANTWRICDENMQVLKDIEYVAESQDIASNIQVDLFSDSDLTTRVAYRTLPAGQFNGTLRNLTSSETVTDGETYYLRLQLVNNNVPVATSAIIPIVGVAE